MCEAGEATVTPVTRAVAMGQRDADVEIEVMKCDSCQEEYFLPEQIDAAQEVAARSLRARAANLCERVREKYALSQVDLEKILLAGPKTATRWEAERVIPSGAAETLLIVLDRFPSVAIYLGDLRGVSVGIPHDALLEAEPSMLRRRVPLGGVDEILRKHYELYRDLVDQSETQWGDADTELLEAG